MFGGVGGTWKKVKEDEFSDWRMVLQRSRIFVLCCEKKKKVGKWKIVKEEEEVGIRDWNHYEMGWIYGSGLILPILFDPIHLKSKKKLPHHHSVWWPDRNRRQGPFMITDKKCRDFKNIYWNVRTIIKIVQNVGTKNIFNPKTNNVK